jgi:hypothetical protein
MPGPKLEDVAKRELRSIDRRFRFWVALGVETATGSGASADDVDWESLDWATLRGRLSCLTGPDHSVHAPAARVLPRNMVVARPAPPEIPQRWVERYGCSLRPCRLA